MEKVSVAAVGLLGEYARYLACINLSHVMIAIKETLGYGQMWVLLNSSGHPPSLSHSTLPFPCFTSPCLILPSLLSHLSLYIWWWASSNAVRCGKTFKMLLLETILWQQNCVLLSWSSMHTDPIHDRTGVISMWHEWFWVWSGSSFMKWPLGSSHLKGSVLLQWSGFS